MPAPVPVPEHYINLTAATITIGTSPNTASLTVNAGGLTHTVNTDDMTSNTSGGWEEDVQTTQKMEGDVTVLYVSGAWPAALTAGAIFPTVIAVPSGPTISGNFRFNDVNRPVLDPTKGLKISMKMKNQGLITITN